MLKKGRILILLLVVFMLFSLSCCTGQSRQAASVFSQYAQGELQVSADGQSNDIYIDARPLEELVRISRTDMTALCFNDQSCVPGVYDAGSRKLWRCLPESYQGEQAAVVQLTLLIGARELTLNSQRDAETSYEIKEDSVVVTYHFTGSTLQGDAYDISLPVEYKGSDGAMSVSLSCADILGEKADDKVRVRSVGLLPYLGAGSPTQKGDFILIPDSCGTAIDIGTADGEPSQYSVKVYADEKGTDEASAVIPAFGMKIGSGAFVALIEKGDAIASVKAHKAGSDSGSNRVYAEFEITPVLEAENGLYICEQSYQDEIRLSYRFVSGENTEYIGMASVVRELLIRNGSLTSYIQQQEGYPFNLSIIAADEQGIKTTYSQCYDIISALTGKGLSDISLRYRGAVQSASEDYDFTSSMGDGEQLEELYELAASRGVDIYADIALFDSGTDRAALTLDGKTCLYSGQPLSPGVLIKDNVSRMLYALSSTELAGICLNDATEYLYGDYTEGELTDRAQLRQLLFGQMNSVSATKKLMVEKGNLYALKYASSVVELPDKTYYASQEHCSQVPFVQAVLHGLYDYSLSPVNLAEDSETAFLRAIEYGAIPYYEWCYSESQPELCYVNSINRAQLHYERAKTALSDLRDEKITEHTMLASGVYLTVYGGTSEIYVNYNDEPVTVSGFTVDAKSFLRVN